VDREELTKKARRTVAWYRKHRDWLGLADRSLRALYYARDGNPARMVAAGISIGADVVNKAFPETSIDDDLRQRGYHLLDTPIGGLLCDILAQNGTPSAIIEKGHKETAKIWESKLEGAAAVYYNDEYHAGPYILGSDDGFLLDAIMRQVWSKGTDLMLTTNPDTNIRKGSKRFALVPIPDPGPYIGEPGPRYYANRLSSYGNRPRTMLLKGPSGIGKSVLARHIAALSRSGSSRTLKIAGSALSKFGSAELRDIARFLQPSVMLLDDLNIGSEEHRSRYGSERMLEALLDVLEALRVEGCLVIATMMVDTDRSDDRYRGDNYVEGMRPGRIDEVVTMFAPEEKERGAILDHYYGMFGVEIGSPVIQKKIVGMTDGLTGAYLREVAERIYVHGLANLADEIEAVLQASPPPARRKERPPRARIRRIRKPRTSKQLAVEARKIERYATKLRKQSDKEMKRAERRRATAEKKAKKEEEEMNTKKNVLKKTAGKKTAEKKTSEKKTAGKKTSEKKTVKAKPVVNVKNDNLVTLHPVGVLGALEDVDNKLERRLSLTRARARGFYQMRHDRDLFKRVMLIHDDEE